MSAGAIDDLLAQWEEHLRRVDENLLALEGEPTYQMLSGATLDGQTKRVVEPALEALRNVFEQRGKLTSVIDRAKELRIPLFTAWFRLRNSRTAQSGRLSCSNRRLRDQSSAS